MIKSTTTTICGEDEQPQCAQQQAWHEIQQPYDQLLLHADATANMVLQLKSAIELFLVLPRW
jgi:hypothetical protein